MESWSGVRDWHIAGSGRGCSFANQRERLQACGRVPEGAGQLCGGNPGRGGRARSGHCRGRAAGSADGPRAWAAGARTLGSGDSGKSLVEQTAADAWCEEIFCPKRERGH